MDIKVVEETMWANYDQLFIFRGPRTKRPRPTSFTSSSSIGGSSSGAHGEGEAEVHAVGHDHGYDGSSSSVAVSTIEFFKNTDEEEAMANCLILLAQGNKNNEQRQNRRKTTETVTETREGLSVFECKTCNRSFGSFQALGGHRASHRKPKATINEEKKAVHHPAQFNISETSSHKLGFPSDPRTGNKVVYMNNNKSKGHECSICGADFSSGQALGGHMRRHRNTIPVATAMMNKLENSSENLRRNVFSLDLNLPAPEEDLEVPENNNFSRLPQPLLFSAPALVDCHY